MSFRWEDLIREMYGYTYPQEKASEETFTGAMRVGKNLQPRKGFIDTREQFGIVPRITHVLPPVVPLFKEQTFRYAPPMSAYAYFAVSDSKSIVHVGGTP